MNTEAEDIAKAAADKAVADNAEADKAAAKAAADKAAAKAAADKEAVSSSAPVSVPVVDKVADKAAADNMYYMHPDNTVVAAAAAAEEDKKEKIREEKMRQCGSPNGDICPNCGQYKSDTGKKYKCCNHVINGDKLGSEYCSQLSDGENCFLSNLCQSGWCGDNDKCLSKKNEGEQCTSGSGDDDSCVTGLECGQYGDNDYRCCKNAIVPSGSLSDWCNDLQDGTRCFYDVQCHSGVCGDDKKCTSKKRFGEDCAQDGDDDSCLDGLKCAQWPGYVESTKANSDYKCCPSTWNNLFSGEWCENVLESGATCHDDDQCKSDNCSEKRCR